MGTAGVIWMGGYRNAVWGRTSEDCRLILHTSLHGSRLGISRKDRERTGGGMLLWYAVVSGGCPRYGDEKNARRGDTENNGCGRSVGPQRYRKKDEPDDNRRLVTSTLAIPLASGQSTTRRDAAVVNHCDATFVSGGFSCLETSTNHEIRSQRCWFLRRRSPVHTEGD